MYSFPFGTTIGLTLKNEKKKCYEKQNILIKLPKNKLICPKNVGD